LRRQVLEPFAGVRLLLAIDLAFALRLPQAGLDRRRRLGLRAIRYGGD